MNTQGEVACRSPSGGRRTARPGGGRDTGARPGGRRGGRGGRAEVRRQYVEAHAPGGAASLPHQEGGHCEQRVQ